MRLPASVLLLSAVLLPSTTSAEEPFWNQFRGPYANGTSKAVGVPVKFHEGSKEIAWKVPVEGRAWASPVVWGNQIWLANAPEIQNPPGATNVNANPGPTPALEKPLVLSAICLDVETGKVLHDLDLFEVYRPQYTHPTNSLASCTPWVEEGRLYIHFGSYGTACVDTKTGKKLWERTDIECHHWRGPGSSVVVHGDKLYLNFDGYDKQFIIALDKNTGKTSGRETATSTTARTMETARKPTERRALSRSAGEISSSVRSPWQRLPTRQSTASPSGPSTTVA